MNDREYALLITLSNLVQKLLLKTGHMSSEAHELNIQTQELEVYTKLSGYED